MRADTVASSTRSLTAGATLAAMALCCPAVALADPSPFMVSGDLGGTARYIDHVDVSDPSGFGMNVGARSEINVLGGHLKADIRYVDGNLFSPSEDRFFDVSFSSSSPALIFLAADIQEVYYRNTSRQGDGLFYAHGGLGFKGRLLGRAKASVGVSYLAADAPSPEDGRQTLGAYVGLEHMARTKWVDSHIRATWFVAPFDGAVHTGLSADGDLSIKIPAGPVTTGPRLDVAYRNLGLNNRDNPLFGQTHELTASLGWMVQWGAGDRG